MMAQKTQDAALLVVPDRSLSSAHMQLGRAGWAARYYGAYDRARVLRIADAVAQAAFERAGHYAEWAVRETGFGVAAHKQLKNELSARAVLAHYRDLDLVTPRVDAEKKLLELPKPAGVVFALTPATNPVATIYYKTLLAILSRNAIVFSPHPAAQAVCADAANYLARVAQSAGAPAGLIQCIANPSVPLVQRIMASDKIAVILATGGSAMVRAAYSSSNPALGVGPGNGVAYVDPSAHVDRAARCLVDSKSFDNSVLCTNESVVLTLESHRGNVERALRTAGAHVCNADETARLRDYLFTDAGFTLQAIGKNAVWIADQAGLRVSRNTRVLVPVVPEPGRDDALFKEKLCPVLTLTAALDFQQAVTFAKQVAARGAGHCAAFHGQDDARLLHYAREMPVYRVVVNAPCAQGASGFATWLPPTFMVGTGFKGRSSVDENVGPQHLVHWTRVAYNKDAAVPFGAFDAHMLQNLHSAAPPAAVSGAAASNASVSAAWMPDASVSGAPAPAASVVDRDLLRQLILEEIQGLGRQNP